MGDRIRLIEPVRTVARGARLAERHQNLAFGTELEYLLDFAIRALAVGEPDGSIFFDQDAVWENEHAFTPTFQQLAGLLEFQNRRQVRAGAGVRAASLGYPDMAAGRDKDRAGGAHRPAAR